MGIPGDKTSSKGTNNGVWIQTDDGVKVYLVHMKKDSISVGKGKRVEIGTEIGRTGSSGRSTEPHIHLGAGKLHSVRFQNVKVGINGGDFDPWERTLDAWDIKRGYFFKGK
jgi:murein DD-endopeptidase MepM/ murein hydrolase activator NlpD